MLCAPAFAVTIERPLQDAAQEQEAQRIFHELKCVVCEGQALGESDAPLAHQMREDIRAQVAQGKTQTQVLDYFRARYGARVLLDPPVERGTWLLWAAPLLLLAAGAFLLGRNLIRPAGRAR
ncbi:MAG: cytochrome c-type biogenesis protein CcmH [Alphaproteobacteria bacterium]